MIKWYLDKKIGIEFSEQPHPCMRFVMPSMTEAEKDNINRYPFMNRKNLKVNLHDFVKDTTYSFTIPKGYKWDGATIPRMFWRLIGSKTDPAFLIPSMVHDVICEHHHYVDNDRYFADKVFERLLFVSGVPAYNRWIMFHFVDNWQKFCGWDD